jgi:DNA-binding response OmpR family regulator
MYAEFLRANGFSVTEVDSTDAGLSAATAADLVITGIRVPGSFDGVELVRRLRGDTRTKDTPLIVLTACAFEPDQARAFAVGCDVFLPKPCLPEMLLAETRRLIGEASRLRVRGNEARIRSAVAQQNSEQLIATSDHLVKHTKRLMRRKRR